MTNKGRKALPAGETLAPFRRVKVSSSTWVYADADDAGQGVTLDEERASGDNCNASLHTESGSIEIEAAGAVTQGADCFAAADGKIQALPSSAGTYYKCGEALEAATASGDIIEVVRIGVGETTVVE